MSSQVDDRQSTARTDDRSAARTLMDDFVRRSGLIGDRPPRRYLWTDAFAVCNLLTLVDTRMDGSALNLALRLVDQVHEVLGRDAAGDWLGGMTAAEQREHPTRHGLRIGKSLTERGAAEPFDETLEWERDGQYFHYLTRWMHALEQLARATDEARFHRWAVELSTAAHAAFVYRDPRDAALRMYWKMSVGLDRPLVASMGHHDPLDGWVTASWLAASRFASDAERQTLSRQIGDFQKMCRGRDWVTDDPLGLGGLMGDAWRLWLMVPDDAVDPLFVSSLLDAAIRGIRNWSRLQPLQMPASQRLAFRELGLAIGLQSVQRVDASAADRSSGGEAIQKAFAGLAEYQPLTTQITSFWLQPANQRQHSWQDHQDINSVMLATALLPPGD